MATDLGKISAYTSECHLRNAPSSIHSKEDNPFNTLPGSNGCDPTVFHSPINLLSCFNAGFICCGHIFQVIPFQFFLLWANYQNSERLFREWKMRQQNNLLPCAL